MSKDCKNCFYNDKCPSEEVCEDYTPLEEEQDDAEIDELIEARRIEFRKEWVKYIEEKAD